MLVGLDKTFAVSDHDFSRFSITPSVTLAVGIPENIVESFYRGNVFVGFKGHMTPKIISFIFILL